MNRSYEDFLRSKIETNTTDGLEVHESNLNKNLFKFQKHVVKRALKDGKHAIFADTGLGKTIMQLSWADAVVKNTNQPVLILAPLAVSGQTIGEGEKFGVDLKKISENIDYLQITNYEQLDNIDVSKYIGVVLDESSILKNFAGKLRNKIIDTFKNTPYKLACTATPSPNDPMELGNHSEFLNQMSYNEMLSMFFVHDGGNTSKWKLKGHAEKDFYRWIGSWATVITDPSDLGFHEESKQFELPELEYNEQMIITPKRDNGLLFNENNVNATDFNRELRETRSLRLDKVKEVLNKDDYFIIWINHNEDEVYFRQILTDYDYRIVTGSDNPDKKEKDLIDFSAGKYKILITKGKIAGMGMNFQHCHRQIIAGLDFSFEKLYQQVRRSYRFGQKDKVLIDLITTDTMVNVSEKIKEKEKEFNKLRSEMKNIINKDGEMKMEKPNSEDHEYPGIAKLLKGDCVQRIKEIESDSIGFSIFSPPFASLYTYSDNIEDMGNSKNYNDFFEHFKYLAKELYRVLQPGRNISIHCMNLPCTITHHGFIGIEDFRGDIIRLFQECGFIYHSEVCIWKDPVIAMQRTKALGLLHKQVKKDSTKSRQGVPDYLVTMRKPGENKKPVSGEFDHFCGDENTFKNTGNLSIDIWQRYASPVWMDINPSNTLQYRSAKAEKDEKHICPLQLDVIHRALQLWSAEGDTVLTPFMGIGSEVYESVKLGRKAIGIELKDSYFKQAVGNTKQAIDELNQASLFSGAQ
jgi:DNA modification methylase